MPSRPASRTAIAGRGCRSGRRAGAQRGRRPGDRRPLRRNLRAASYYAAALAMIDESDGLVEEERLWERQRECWDRAVALLGAERLSIAYEHTTLPGYFFSGGPGARPLVVVDHGGRVATSAAWAAGGAAAAARGYHWMTFDGPGRQAALHRQGLVLRPDWEAVLGPVADEMIARADVDASRMAVIGIDHAGYRDQSFDRELHLATLFAPELPGRLRRLGRGYDLSGLPLYELARRIGEFRLGEELRRIPRRCSPAPSAPSRRGQSKPRSSVRDCRAPSTPAPRRATMPCRTGSIGSCNPHYRRL